MSGKPKLWCLDYAGYARPFLSQFDVTDDPTKAHTLLLTGGEDISPALYGEQRVGSHTYFTPRRDQIEVEAVKIARDRMMPILGICRGAQLLCAQAGGKLVQDVTGHIGGHNMITSDGEILQVSSLHHQMMIPTGTKHKMLAWSKRLSAHYWNGENEEIFPKGLNAEPEVVWFDDIQGLGIQGHPEMMPHNHPTLGYFRRLVDQYILQN